LCHSLRLSFLSTHRWRVEWWRETIKISQIICIKAQLSFEEEKKTGNIFLKRWWDARMGLWFRDYWKEKNQLPPIFVGSNDYLTRCDYLMDLCDWRSHNFLINHGNASLGKCLQDALFERILYNIELLFEEIIRWDIWAVIYKLQQKHLFVSKVT
jgi:hypothetical protein